MKRSSLDKQIKAHYREQTLSENKLAQLLAQTALADGRDGTAHRGGLWRWPSRVGAVAASLIVALFVAQLMWEKPAEFLWQVRAAQEIALNHRKQLEAEFVATDIESLRAQMGKLDFSLIAPARLASSGLRIVGARYCSIQGHLAAQLKLENDAGELYTLYQTHDAGLISSGDQRTEVGNVDIVLWEELGMFFGLAKSIN